MTAGATSLDQTLDIETPELAVITYSIAGVGARVKAGVIDQLVCLGLYVALVVAFLALGSPMGSAIGAWAGAVLVILGFLILYGYYLLFEGLRDGQTIGKRAAGIRVVKDGGYSISFGASAARNILRIIDFQPVGLPAVGLLSIAFSKSGKRIGDMVAGTIVVREQTVRAYVGDLHPGSIPAQLGLTRRMRPPDRDGGQVASVLSDPEFELLERFVQRRSALSASDRAAMVARLSERFRGRIAHDREGHSAFLLDLYEREAKARQSGLAARGATGAARERYAIVSEGRARWAAFAKRVAEIRRKGLDKVSEQELSDFVASYRETAGDLARLRTAAQGADPGEVFYLSRVVAAGHNLFYRSGRTELATIERFLFHDVPREVVRSWKPIALSALLFFGSVGIAYSSVRAHPQTTESLVGPGMIERAEEGVTRSRNGSGYVEIPKAERPITGSWIMTNNIRVALMAFAAGVTLIGTPFVLMMNGMSIGAVLGLYANKGILLLLLAFVIPHSVLELSAITIAGGAGLLVSLAVMAPGRLTRRDAVVSAAQRSLRLIACSTVFLLFAGLLEGNVSPNPRIPISQKLLFALGSLVAMALYLSLGRRSRELPAPLSPDNDLSLPAS